MIRVGNCVLLGSLVLCANLTAWAAGDASAQKITPTTAEALYTQLRSVGLDASRVYQIREAALDRSALHITFDSGTIAFTQDVYGRITGAFFEGEGEVLLTPPNHVERSSMALFTGMAILEEQFLTAYFRFNDDVYTELQPALRPAENAQEFVSEWDETARRLADTDALRLLISFSRLLPDDSNDPAAPAEPNHTDRMLHARIQGRALGNFDVLFDMEVQESLWAGQPRTVDGTTYYDLWTSFAPSTSKSPHNEVEQASDLVTIASYKIRADVKPPTDLNGDTRLRLSVRRGGSRVLMFELSRFLHVKRVDENGHPLAFINNQALQGTQLEKRGNDLVAVIFPAPLKTGQKLELHFVYGGEVLSEAGQGLLYVGARGTWYPNRGMAPADFDLEFHYPAGWTLVATGKSAPVTPAAVSATEAPGGQVSRWVSERPIPFAGFNLGKYAHAVARAGNVVVESYATAGFERTFPKPAQTEIVPVMPDVRHSIPAQAPVIAMTVAPTPSPARNAQPVADQSARAVDFFARRFGPYPYSSLQLTQLPGYLSQGWPGLVFLSSYSFLTPAERKDLHMDRLRALLSSQVPVHETAHQWWGDLIGWASYRDQWIMEALANYSALMMMETENPSEFRDLMEKFRRDLLQKNKDGQLLKNAGPVTLGARLSSSHFPDGYDAISYGRGTWLLHMLREMMRDAESTSHARAARLARPEDDPFVRSLRKLRERYEGKEITTHDFLNVLEEDLPPSLRYEGRKSLDWFFSGWINGTALPRFEVQSVKYLEKENSTLVSGTLLQKDAPQDLVTPVPIYGVIAGKTPVLLGRVFAEGRETTFHLSAPMGTRKIAVDPYQTLLTAPK
jgi:Peptidase family M1 domain